MRISSSICGIIAHVQSNESPHCSKPAEEFKLCQEIIPALLSSLYPISCCVFPSPLLLFPPFVVRPSLSISSYQPPCCICSGVGNLSLLFSSPPFLLARCFNPHCSLYHFIHLSILLCPCTFALPSPPLRPSHSVCSNCSVI